MRWSQALQKAGETGRVDGQWTIRTVRHGKYVHVSVQDTHGFVKAGATLVNDSATSQCQSLDAAETQSQCPVDAECLLSLLARACLGDQKLTEGECDDESVVPSQLVIAAATNPTNPADLANPDKIPIHTVAQVALALKGFIPVTALVADPQLESLQLPNNKVNEWADVDSLSDVSDTEMDLSFLLPVVSHSVSSLVPSITSHSITVYTNARAFILSRLLSLWRYARAYLNMHMPQYTF
ncbi:hypothetical protein HDU81_008492 [Chytriomyces hyalinus]|nr:hypothetical protein HDU81_008492 [Chytriomyces hyalinus]